MNRYKVLLREVISQSTLSDNENITSGTVEFEVDLTVIPGQYFQVWRDSDKNPLPIVSYTASLFKERRLLLDQIPINWNPGENLNLWGPLGKGFGLETGVNSVYMAAIEGNPVRLLPIISHALAKGNSVSLFLDQPNTCLLASLPVEIEIQPLASLPEELDLAEYLYIDVARRNLPRLRSLLSKRKNICPGQVLVRSDMPCAGIADCQICALETQRGLKLTCQDGPVFRLEDLLNVV